MTNISTNFSLAEVTISQEAERRRIDNSLPPALLPAAKNTAVHMELVRTILKQPIHINSWYRCIALNRAIGSKDTSAHPRAEAVDFISPKYGNPLKIARELIKYPDFLDWDQLIWEHSWIHIAWNFDPARKNRRQVLTLMPNGTYATGLVDK